MPTAQARARVVSSPKSRALVKAFLDARFEAAQKISKSINWTRVIDRALKESPDAMTAVSMSTELLDYFGDTATARRRLGRLVPPAESTLQAFVEGKTELRSDRERSILKRWTSILLQSALLEYRGMVLDRAGYLCRLCLSALKKLRSVPDYACYGTLSRVYYAMGLIHREQFNYPEAKKSFLIAIEMAWESLREKQNVSASIFRQSRWTDVTIARALGLGLGYVYHMDGQPDLAIPVLLSAKNMLARNGETLLSNYVDLVYLDARRSAYGADALTIDDAIAGLERCYEVFKARKHKLYSARAAYSLALAYSQRARPDERHELTPKGAGDLERAGDFAMLLERYKPGDGAADQRHALYALLCMSRIHRKADRLDRAVELATQGIENGGRAHSHIHVGLLIARAEAYLRQGRQDDAITDLRDALDESKHSLRAHAVCLLRLTQIHARLGHRTKALEYFDGWQQISPHVSNAHLWHLEEATRAALNAATPDFKLDMSRGDIDRKHETRRFHAWLVDWATRDGASNAEAAERLGLSREGFAIWKRDAKRFAQKSSSSDPLMTPAPTAVTARRLAP